MKSKAYYIYHLLYLFFALFFLSLFVEESPFGKNKKLLQFREIFAVGWNFFTKDPRLDLTEVYYFKNNEWIELGKSGKVSDVLARVNDGVQMEIFAYGSLVSEDKWIKYNSMTDCYFDTITQKPQTHFVHVQDHPNKYQSIEFIKKNYGEYFLVINAKKMPWAWINTYSQSKMKCKSLIIKL